MIGLSRRMFLKRGSMVVAMAGVATTPLVSGVAGPEASKALSNASALPEGVQMTDELVAHVRDLASGEINVFFGEQHIVLKDPGLAHAIFRATR